MSKFDWAMTVLLHHEGGFVDHPADPGGATKWGISLRFYRANVKPNATVADIKNLSMHDCRAIYREYFWDPARCDEVKSELLTVKIFDMAVNMGQKRAYRLVQRAINSLQYTPKLTVDGLVGPATLRALNSYTRQDWELLNRIRSEQAAYYERLIERRPKLAAFRVGWRRRAAS